MRTWADLVASVDRVRFRTACATLIDEQLASELCDRVLAAPLTPADRLELALRLFQELPLYTVLGAARALLPDLTRQERERLWHQLAASVAKERSAGADAAETALFADFFADPLFVEEAWGTLVSREQPEVCVRCALRVSASVPWRLKRVLFARLLPDARWHPLLFQALRGARHAFFGATVDREEGLLVLDRLALPGREPELVQLQRELAALP